MSDLNGTATGHAQLTLMAVRAHPDDECFEVGGTLARYSRRGIKTVLVISTGGENGEIVDPILDTAETKARLAEVRYQELTASCGILGIANLEMLGFRDSGMAGTPENDDPRSFNKAPIDEAAGRLVRLIRAYRPQVLLADNEEGSYGHPDHIMSNRVSTAAFERAADPDYRSDRGPAHRIDKLYYAGFAHSQVVQTWRRMREIGRELPWRDEADGDGEPSWGMPDAQVGAMIDVRAEVPQKVQALLAHRTQVKPDWWMFTLPDDILAEFMGHEAFRRVHSTVPVDGREDDLFANLREGAAAALR